MTVKELREEAGMSKKQFSEYFNIPYKTIQNWESETGEKRICPSYLIELMQYKLAQEGLLHTALINREE